MKKYLLLIVLLALVVFSADAQRRRSSRNVSSGNKLAVAADLLVPVGDASDFYSVGFGATLKLEIPVATSTLFTANIGYASMQYTDDWKAFHRSFGSRKSADGWVPILAGVKHYVNNQFFLEGQIGAAVASGDNSGTAFAYTPGVGFTLPAGDGNAIDLGVRYEGWSKNGTIGMFGLRVAYKFGI